MHVFDRGPQLGKALLCQARQLQPNSSSQTCTDCACLFLSSSRLLCCYLDQRPPRPNCTRNHVSCPVSRASFLLLHLSSRCHHNIPYSFSSCELVHSTCPALPRRVLYLTGRLQPQPPPLDTTRSGASRSQGMLSERVTWQPYLYLRLQSLSRQSCPRDADLSPATLTLPTRPCGVPLPLLASLSRSGRMPPSNAKNHMASLHR